MTDDLKFAYQSFEAAARRFHAANTAHDIAFAAFTEAQDAWAATQKEVDDAKSELAEAQEDLIAEIVGGGNRGE